MKNYKFSILMPVYNGEAVIKDAIESLLKQDYKNFEIIVCDDCSRDRTEVVIKKIKDKRIKYFRNKKNLGYGKNIERCRRLASENSEIIFLMAQDDFLRKKNLTKINYIFNRYPEVGAIIRPFYMFTTDINRPIRDFAPYNREKDSILSIWDGYKAIDSVFRTVCQLSGLAFRKDLMQVPFNKHVMTSHIYPFLEIFKKHKIMFLKDYSIAVRTLTSQTRNSPKIYKSSPTAEWLELVNKSFKEEKYRNIKKISKEIVLKNYVALVQIKNFSTMSNLIREYKVFIVNRWISLLNIKFWFYFLITLLVPKFILLPFVDFYKDKVLSIAIKSRNIKFIKA